jgi:branched-subunit amino acid ABC-type transport system permease component
MITVKSLLGQQMFAAFMLVLVLGGLSMIWPAIIAVFLGVILLLQSFTAEPEVVLLSWAEIDNMSVVVASLRRPGLPSIVS